MGKSIAAVKICHFAMIMVAMTLLTFSVAAVSGCKHDDNSVTVTEISSANDASGSDEIDGLKPSDDGADDGSAIEIESAALPAKDEAAAAIIDEAISMGSKSQILDKSADSVADAESGISNDAKAQFVRAWGKFSEMHPGLTEMNQEMADLVMSEFFNFPNKIMAAYPYAVGADGFEKLSVSDEDVQVLCSDSLVDTVAKVIVTCRNESGEPKLIITGFYDQLSDSVKVEDVSEVSI